MALILKENKTFTDSQGYTHSDFYSVVDNIQNCKKNCTCNFQVLTYKDGAARNNNTQPVAVTTIRVDGQNWQNNFSVASLDKNLFAKAYEFVLTLDVFADWESDE